MADKPVLFSGPMVRALLAGTKTQTRRTLKGAPAEATSAGTTYSSETGHSNVWTWLSGDPIDIDTWGVLDDFRLPYKVGDRLYVREHWRVSNRWNGTAPRDLAPKTMTVFFEAGGSISNDAHDRGGEISWQPSSYGISQENANWVGKRRQAMHMPRWASRITLTVTDVRVQRLQDISEADAWAEGLERIGDGHRVDQFRIVLPDKTVTALFARDAYRAVWEAINGPGSWAANPWVAAYTFTVQTGNIDQLAQAA